MQKTKALNWLFSREYEKSGKAGRFLFLGGWMLRKFQGEEPEVWLALPSELWHDLVTGGIPHAGSWHSHLHLPNSPCAPVCYISWAVCLLSFWFLFLRLFLTWTILKLLLNLLPHCFFFMFPFFWLRVVWDLGSLTTGRWILNHWTSRGLPSFVFFL